MFRAGIISLSSNFMNGISDLHEPSSRIPVRLLAFIAAFVRIRETEVRAGFGLDVVTPNVSTSRPIHTVWVTSEYPI